MIKIKKKDVPSRPGQLNSYAQQNIYYDIDLFMQCVCLSF